MTLSGEHLQQTARDTAAALAHANRGRPFTPHLDVFKVRDKVFLIVTEDDPDPQTITVKVDPHHGDALRRDHDSITPGHYLDKQHWKQHWISVGAGQGVTKRLIEDQNWTGNGAEARVQRAHTQTFQAVSVDEDTLEYVARTAGGEVVDSSTIVQGQGGKRVTDTF